MPEATSDFAQMWEWFATHCHDYSPLYERIAGAVAGDAELLARVQAAPPDAHLPPALLAAVHYVVLEEPGHPLADIYAGRAGPEADPAPVFLQFCRDYSDAVMSVLATRHIQTNECGRSALIGPGLTWLSSRVEAPLALVDVGASAGLNLRCDRYRIDYGSHGATGDDDSPVRLECRVTGGDPPIAAALPPLVSRIGIDRSPINLTDPDDARWLLACVWPDTGRLERTAAAIRLAQADPPTVIAGDANDTLPGVLATLPDTAAAVVTTTWAFAYFSLDDRQRFVEILEAAAQARPVAWVSAEGAGTVAAFDSAVSADDVTRSNDVLGVSLFTGGVARHSLLGFVQEHGAWIDWRA